MFDLVNFDIGGNDGRGRAVDYRGSASAAPVRNVKVPKSKRIEEVVVSHFIGGIQRFDFDPAVFASMIAMTPLALQKKVLTAFLTVIDYWSIKYDEQMYQGNEELDFLVNAKRIQDAASPFRAFMER